MPLEKLDGSLVLFGCLARLESTEITPLSGLRVLLAGIQTIVARLKFSNHDRLVICVQPRCQLRASRSNRARFLRMERSNMEGGEVSL